MISILIGITGVIILAYSIWILIKSRNNECVNQFTFNSEINEIQLHSTGLYSICILGASFVNDQGKFDAELKSDSGNLIELNKPIFKYRFRKKGILGLEYYQFEISKSGKYFLSFKNQNELVAKHSMLISKRIFQKRINPNSLKVLVKETISTRDRMISIVGLVIGINAVIWGILAGFLKIFE
ncbi:hypothetical protein BST97_05950 [Nonlabens spongiae]|uniref:Uncharacterized protein n=1 Tax=Nonlabens spongiae TaxID=331648 RepID=A0A1W6MIX5_9FLAO|nr:hypothetical protein [Nonlabens spongiae]ARN77568.1 hypothetical protein BST97_05950 [Nonlabens spongiae]